MFLSKIKEKDITEGYRFNRIVYNDPFLVYTKV